VSATFLPCAKGFACPANANTMFSQNGARTVADLVRMAEALQLGNGKDEPCLSC
jgi:hypothetical protein